MLKRIKILLFPVLAIYLLLCALPYIFEDQLVFQGVKLPADHKFTFNGDWEELSIPMNDGISLNAILFKTTSPRAGVILYFHGNADNLERWGTYREDFLSRGYDVLMYDYRGYGKSQGTPSEEKLLIDGSKMFDEIQRRYAGEEIIIYGRSLGSAVASHVAQLHPAKILFLETPFDSIQTAFNSKFPFLLRPFPKKYNFSNINSLQKGYDIPVHIFHGTKDRLVPLKSALKLKSFLKPRDSFTIIEGGGHRNLSEFSSFQKALDQYLGEKL